MALQMDKLSGMFQSHTGQQFGGSSMQSQMMAKFVSSKLGYDVPPQMLEKMYVPCPPPPKGPTHFILFQI